jgi:hypothetical protein
MGYWFQEFHDGNQKKSLIREKADRIPKEARVY